jgi:amino acid transporter
MRKTIIVCGLIAGVIVSLFMISSTTQCYVNGNFDSNIVVGYASMLLAFSLIFVGVKNYRDKYNNGFVSFGKALKIGLNITLIASTVYVVVWLFDYYLFVPDFMDKYAAHVLSELKAKGVSGAEYQEEVVKMDGYKEMYKNPIMVILFTYLEILPVGLVVSLLSAVLLKRTPTHQMPTA